MTNQRSTVREAESKPHPTAIILANGDPPPLSLFKQLVETAASWGGAPLLIAADGAAQRLRELGWSPHLVVGDFDSLPPALREELGSSEFLHVPDQETSDIEKAVQVALERGAQRILLMGTRGDRLDHWLTALSVMMAYHARVRIQLVDTRFVCEIVQGSLVWRGRAGDTISLVAFQQAEGVSLEGVRWPLRGETLAPGSRGVSNVMTGDEARLSVRQGFLLLCREHRGELRSRL